MKRLFNLSIVIVLLVGCFPPRLPLRFPNRANRSIQIRSRRRKSLPRVPRWLPTSSWPLPPARWMYCWWQLTWIPTCRPVWIGAGLPLGTALAYPRTVGATWLNQLHSANGACACRQDQWPGASRPGRLLDVARLRLSYSI
jgi:hypothetical protein